MGIEAALVQLGGLGILAAALWKLHERCEARIVDLAKQHDLRMGQCEERQQAITDQFVVYLESQGNHRREERTAAQERHMAEHRAVLEGLQAVVAIIGESKPQESRT